MKKLNVTSLRLVLNSFSVYQILQLVHYYMWYTSTADVNLTGYSVAYLRALLYVETQNDN
jgi:hypothetical protein